MRKSSSDYWTLFFSFSLTPDLVIFALSPLHCLKSISFLFFLESSIQLRVGSACSVVPLLFTKTRDEICFFDPFRGKDDPSALLKCQCCRGKKRRRRMSPDNLCRAMPVHSLTQSGGQRLLLQEGEEEEEKEAKVRRRERVKSQRRAVLRAGVRRSSNFSKALSV